MNAELVSLAQRFARLSTAKRRIFLERLQGEGLDFAALPKDRVGIYIGCTEHGNVETENEIYAISKFGYDTKYWSHYHNPRTVANNPAGETSLNLGVTGPAYTIGAACAAGTGGADR